MQAGVWFQKCYDIDCSGFRSEAMPLPPAVLLEAATVQAAASPAPAPGALDPAPLCGTPSDPGHGATPSHDPAGPIAGSLGGQSCPGEGFAWHADEAADEAAMLAALEAACAPQHAECSGLPGTKAASMGDAAAWGKADLSQEAAMLAAAEAAEGLLAPGAWGLI